mmetsp:Transcript_784/g.1956  ORF Transcript_784/g.1956 Transcript_784/m.1956 type:complete len:229 (+) Transcript_784:371-1057(+)
MEAAHEQHSLLLLLRSLAPRSLPAAFEARRLRRLRRLNLLRHRLRHGPHGHSAWLALERGERLGREAIDDAVLQVLAHRHVREPTGAEALRLPIGRVVTPLLPRQEAERLLEAHEALAKIVRVALRLDHRHRVHQHPRRRRWRRLARVHLARALATLGGLQVCDLARGFVLRARVRRRVGQDLHQNGIEFGLRDPDRVTPARHVGQHSVRRVGRGGGLEASRRLQLWE